MLGNTIIFRKYLGDVPDMFPSCFSFGEMLGIISRMFRRHFLGVPALDIFRRGQRLLGEGNLESLTRFWFQGKDLVLPGNPKFQSHASFVAVKSLRQPCYYEIS